MPSTLTPPPGSRLHEHERDSRDDFGDHGNGRRPPTDKRTGGNGEGDNSNNRPFGGWQPRQRLMQARIGLFFGLGGDLMFFIALVSVFFVDKTSGHISASGHYVNDWQATLLPAILWLNTAILLLSSVSAEFARQSMFREDDIMDEWIGLGRPITRRATAWLSVTLVLGLAFLAGQWLAWRQLAAQHVYIRSTTSSKFFYIITWAHASHLALGALALITALAVLQRSRQFVTRQVFVDATVWFWHAMGALWIFLFLLLEYGQ
jgi:cytochrome c oxidase subunit III